MKHQNISLIILYLFFCFSLWGEPGQISTISENLTLEKISDNMWIHKSTTIIEPWGRVDANGLALMAGEELILIDTPWNDEQTKVLCDWFTRRGAHQITAIVTHYHDDNMGGLSWIHREGHSSYALEKTKEICRDRGLEVPRNTLKKDEILEYTNLTIRVYFPGAAHTVDNLSVYLPDQKILFGGCTVKALENRTPGNRSEADMVQWPKSLERLKEEFSEAELVIPGHGKAGTLALIDHTLSLLENYR